MTPRRQSRGAVRRIDGRRRPWMADWRDETGKRHSRSFPTKAEAESFVSAQVAHRDRVKAGEARRDRGANLGDLLSGRLRALELAGRSESHVRSCRMTFKTFEGIVGPERRASSIIGGDIDQFIDSRQKLATKRHPHGPSVRTIERQVVEVKGAFKWGVRAGLLTFDPVAGYTPPHPSDADRRKRRRPLSEEEVGALIAAAAKRDAAMPATVPQRPLWTFLVVVGSRWSETVALRWADVRDGQARFRPATRKRKRERAPFPLPSSLVADLEALRAAQGRALGSVPGSEDPVFLRRDGQRWPERDADGLRRFYRLLDLAGIDRRDADGREVDRHALRGCAATRLMRAGVPHAVIARLLGAGPDVILKHYARPLESDLEAAVSKLPEIVVATELPLRTDIDHQDGVDVVEGKVRRGKA